MSTPTSTPPIIGVLRGRATHFEEEPWLYTRENQGLRHLRYASDTTGYNRIDRRALRAIAVLFGPTPRFFREIGWGNGWRTRLIGAKVRLQVDDNLPDGTLNNGSVLVHWEEHGEYLQLVQPHIGALIADMLAAHPDLPESQAVLAAMAEADNAMHAEARRLGYAAPEET